MLVQSPIKRSHSCVKLQLGIGPSPVFVFAFHGAIMRLAFAIVLLVATTAQQPDPNGTAKEPSIKGRDALVEQGNKQQKPYGASPAEVAMRNSSVSGPQTDPQTKSAYDPREDALYRWYLGMTIVGVIGAVAGIVVLTCQTIATRHAAGAALLNARALINSERPWLIPTISRDFKDVDTGRQHPSGNPIIQAVPFFTFEFSNNGRSPTHVVSVKLKHCFTKCGEDPPLPPDYGIESEFAQQRMFAPNETPWEYESWTLKTDTLERCDSIVAGEEWYWRYCQIKYRNLIDGSDHESCSCWVYNRNLQKFVISGPREYTKYT